MASASSRRPEQIRGLRANGSRIDGSSLPLAVPIAWGVALLAAVAAGTGLLLGGGDGPSIFTTVRGESVELFGRGLYRFDTTFVGAGARGTDFVTLVLAVPLLLVSSLQFARGSLRGGLVFLGALLWFLYVYGSYAVGTVAYNELFLLYVALFGASLFAFIATFREVERRLAPYAGRIPGRGLAVFMMVSGAATFVIWILDPITALYRGTPPLALAHYTTLFTYGVDLAIIVPAAIIAAIGIGRGQPFGFVTASALLMLEALLAPLTAAQTVSQLTSGVALTPATAFAPIGGFLALSLVAIWFLLQAVRALPDSP